MDVPLWVAKIIAGDRRLLARALSEIENRGPQWLPLLVSLFPRSGQAWSIGVTGAPGAGKSTVVTALASHFRKRDKRVAILAVDPTSPFTGGSILGDRIRMQAHDADPGVYIRSMATRGSLGGLAAGTGDILVALDAAGFDVILIETVGVGQAEVDIVQLASTVALLLTPSTGDDVQAMKAGIMEIADTFVINKADLPGADRLETELRAMLSLKTAPEDEQTPIVRTIATTGDGIDELAASLRLVARRKSESPDYWKRRLTEMIRERFVVKIVSTRLPEERLDEVAGQIARRELNPYSFATELTNELLPGDSINPPRED